VNDKEYNDPIALERLTISTLQDVIMSVDGITDKTMIGEWLSQLPIKPLHEINKKVEDAVEWGPTFETTITCRDCGAPSVVSAPLNPVAFFT